MSARARRLLGGALLAVALLSGCASSGDDMDGGDDAVGGAGTMPLQEDGQPNEAGGGDDEGS